MRKKIDPEDKPKTFKDKLKKYKPLCNVQCDSIANAKGTEPCYIDLYKYIDKLDHLWDCLLETNIE